MKDFSNLPNIVVEIYSGCVRTTPGIQIIEGVLGSLNKPKEVEEPWRLVISPQGEIVDFGNYLGNQDNAKEKVEWAVREFMTHVDPYENGIFINRVLEVARRLSRGCNNVGQTDWEKVNFDWKMAPSICGGFLSETRLALLGASGKHRQDVNRYLRVVLIQEVRRQYKKGLAFKIVKHGNRLMDVFLEAEVEPENFKAFFDDLAAAGEDKEAQVGVISRHCPTLGHNLIKESEH